MHPEYQQLLATLRAARPSRSTGPTANRGWRPITAMIDQSWAVHADRVAIADDTVEVTYGRLAQEVCDLAERLREAGVGRGDLVTLVMDRGLDFVRAALAVWWVGAAYLPLHPQHPEQWRRRLSDLAGSVLTLHDATAPPSARTSPAELAPGDLAYVISTSGSTGEPKLVMVEHGGVANLADAQREFLRDGVGPGDRVVQFCHPSYDAALFDVLMALPTGARLETISSDELSGEALAAVLTERRITHAVLPAAVLRTLEPGFPDLRVVMSMGDVCLPETARRWSGRHLLVNGYGPTETTIAATLHVCDPDEPGRVPIGKPLSGYRIVVVDEELRPVPAGVAGEICIGGAGVGRGYLGRPDLTAERFVTDADGRLYRSGDLGRMRDDGVVEFLGRADDQVKVRGVRLELGQVEAALLSLPGVGQVAAAVAGDVLLGYVVADGLRTGPELRALLSARVPRHLVPDTVVVLDELPLTVNGKIDRSALPAPTGESRQSPRGPVEREIAAIAAELLGVDGLGRDENLFELGGHSLLAAQLVARIRTATGKEVDLSTVLDAGTVAAIAAGLRDREPGPTRTASSRRPSFAQERVWLLHELNPSACAYNTQAVFRFHGEFDLAAFEASLTELVRRHDVLRCRFPVVGGELQVEAMEPAPVTVPLVDTVDDQLAGIVHDTVCAPFDLAVGPPVRWLLARLAPDEHIFVHVEHHIVHDGWSFNLFVRELFDGYRGRRQPPLTVNYHDYAEWQRAWCRTAEAEAQRSFWRKELDGASTVLALPRRPLTGPRRFRGVAPRVDIDAELAGRLVDLADRVNASLFIVLLTAFFVLLRRYTGADDLLVGSAVANRRWRQVEDVIGMFVNTVVFRGRTHGDPTFAELVARVREMSFRVYDNQELPFEEILGTTPVSRSAAGANPLIQALFSLHEAPLGPFAGAPFDTSLIQGVSNGSAKFDLAVVAVPRYARPGHISRLDGDLIVAPRSDDTLGPSPRAGLHGITLAWEIDSDLFDAEIIDGIVSEYTDVLRTIVAHPSLRLSELPVRPGSIQVGVSVPAKASWLPSLVDGWATRDPDAPAVGPLTYGELVARADRVAAALDPGGAIAVCLPKGPDLVVAQLGVLKARSAFLNLDPADPSPRLQWLLDDSRATAVVTSAELAPRFAGRTVITLDDLPAPLPPVVGSGSDLAYVIYTSGSTGTPKAVAVSHAALLARFAGLVETGPGDRMLAAAASTFDVSVYEIWGALTSGAAVSFLAPDLTVREPVSHAFLTPAVFGELVARTPEVFDGMKDIMVGGDVMPAGPVAALLERGITALRNAYGPTEAVVIGAVHRVLAAEDPVPIGTALPNTVVAVLDSNLRPVPPGAVGEICLGGPTLAEGYLGDPSLTAQRFVPNPFGPGQLYRTGDLGRWLPGGVLAYLGRRDEQVKIRGVRVELGEVRAALARLPGVSAAEAVADRDAHGELIVHGYVVPELDGTQLRRALAAFVPASLVPAVIHALPSFPLTPNGKVDRSRLPRTAPPAAGHVPPRTTEEARLAEIAAELLGRDRVGVHDNLFDLGLHSLQALRLLARLGRDVPLASVFASPTVAELAQVVAAADTFQLLPRRPR
ncbi:amino acid adenylation domain-containing protein [Kutzneria sp. NPDC052558]|uniref:amino acid adenylation domain-containing protein n=1 Tax=Kutzneria sp. NPDC052558 TaxID=3364121 RepID=UPI0037CA4A75